jgi:hypothetical protein
VGRLSASLPVFAIAAAATVALAGCGGGGNDELLPGATASQINANLDQVEQLVAEGECIGAENSAEEIGSQVEALSGVDGKLKRALAEGASKLTENVAAECEETSEEEVVPTIEENVEAEPEKEPKAEKPKKEEKEAEKEAEEEAEADDGPTLPPNSNGKGEENGKGKGPPVEPPEGEAPPAEVPPSGGVGPGTAVEGE